MILCLGRNDIDLDELGADLRTLGHEVFLSICVDDALRVFSFHNVKLVIADELLDSPQGASIFTLCRRAWPRTPVVYWQYVNTPPETISTLDPDVIVQRTSGIPEMLKIVAILSDSGTGAA